MLAHTQTLISINLDMYFMRRANRYFFNRGRSGNASALRVLLSNNDGTLAQLMDATWFQNILGDEATRDRLQTWPDLFGISSKWDSEPFAAFRKLYQDKHNALPGLKAGIFLINRTSSGIVFPGLLASAYPIPRPKKKKTVTEWSMRQKSVYLPEIVRVRALPTTQ